MTEETPPGARRWNRVRSFAIPGIVPLDSETLAGVADEARVERPRNAGLHDVHRDAPGSLLIRCQVCRSPVAVVLPAFAGGAWAVVTNGPAHDLSAPGAMIEARCRCDLVWALATESLRIASRRRQVEAWTSDVAFFD